MSRPNVIPTFRQRRCTNRGRNFVRRQTVTPIHEQSPSTYFLRLNNSETFVDLVGARSLHLACARPRCRLKAPLGLSLLRCAMQTRSMRFKRSGRGQEPSRDHKFSILENFLSIRDFTSQTPASFPSNLVGVALVGAKPLHLLAQTALPLKSPTGAFIAPLRYANAVPPQTLPWANVISWNLSFQKITESNECLHRHC